MFASCNESGMPCFPVIRKIGFRHWVAALLAAGASVAGTQGAVSDILKFQSETPVAVLEEVRTEASGTVIKVHVKPGKEVKQGELLAELDHDQQKYQMDLSRSQSEAEGGLRTSMSQLQQRKAELQEVQEQYRKRQVARYRVEVAEALVDHAEGQVRSIKEQKEYFRIQYNYWVREYEKRFVTSPFDGVVTEVKASEGQGVGIAAHVFTVSNPNAVLFEVNVPIESAGYLKPNDKIFVKSQSGGGMTQARVHEVLIDPASNGKRRILRVLMEGVGSGTLTDPSKALSKFDVFLPKTAPVPHNQALAGTNPAPDAFATPVPPAN